MKTLVLIILLVTLLIVFVGWYLETRAPEGYEDADGFHKGKP